LPQATAAAVEPVDLMMACAGMHACTGCSYWWNHGFEELCETARCLVP
jgi:hypothetical protein